MKKIILALVLTSVILSLFSVQAFAITESDVQTVIDSSSKEEVTGNVFIWFLCAIAFLKVSQKIDSFMSSLGINVGHTGGSMMAEALIAARGVSAFKGKSGFSPKGSSGASQAGGFLSGGLAGAVGRQVAKGAVSSVTGNNTSNSINTAIGGKLFANSINEGSEFAENIISTVAKGNISEIGTMTGEKASEALISYMGNSGESIPSFSGVEIGGGRITGTETSVSNPQGISFGMYNADTYTAPTGEFTTETMTDGSNWYKQYAVDTVDRTPYMKPSGEIGYNESIVKTLPKPPSRKDRI